MGRCGFKERRLATEVVQPVLRNQSAKAVALVVTHPQDQFPHYLSHNEVHDPGCRSRSPRHYLTDSREASDHRTLLPRRFHCALLSRNRRPAPGLELFYSSASLHKCHIRYVLTYVLPAGNMTDPCAFEASCASVNLQAYCCSLSTNKDSGLICAPSGDSPFGDPYNCTSA